MTPKPLKKECIPGYLFYMVITSSQLHNHQLAPANRILFWNFTKGGDPERVI